jgi:hypothetical protein
MSFRNRQKIRTLILPAVSLVVSCMGFILYRVWIGPPRVDPNRTLELEAYTYHLRENGGLLVKHAESGSPYTNSIQFEGKSVVGWDDDPIPYLGTGWISQVARSLTALEAFGIWSALWYGVCLMLGVVFIYLFFKNSLNSLGATLSLIATFVVGLFSLLNNSLPFSNVGFTPEVLGSERKTGFIQLHNPWERVDAFYGLGSTVFAACLFFILIIAIMHRTGQLQRFPNWFLGAILAIVLILAELSRLGSSLILTPAALFAIFTIYPTRSKLRSIVRVVVFVALIPILRFLVLLALAVVRQIQTGIPWNLVPFSNSSSHRILLGLSFSKNGYDQPGLGAVVWSDNAVREMVSGEKSLTLLSPEYNAAASDLFIRIVSENPVEFLVLNLEKILFTAHFFELRIVMILALVVILLALKQNSLKSFDLGILGTIAATAILGILPLLASRPFSLFLFYLKPLSDLVLALLIGFVLSSVISKLRSHKAKNTPRGIFSVQQLS